MVSGVSPPIVREVKAVVVTVESFEASKTTYSTIPLWGSDEEVQLRSMAEVPSAVAVSALGAVGPDVSTLISKLTGGVSVFPAVSIEKP